MNKLLAMIYSFLLGLKDDTRAVIDLGVVLMIGIAFVGLTIIAYLIWTIRDSLVASMDPLDALSDTLNSSIANVTTGFDNAVNLILVAITIFILAIAISALLMLRGR